MNFRRRSTLALLLVICVPPAIADAQTTSKVYRLAWLSSGPVIPSVIYTEFVGAMRDLGWAEGANYMVENMLYGGSSERLREIAADAVARKFDVLICAGTVPAVAARQATTTSRSSSTSRATRSVPGS